MFTTSCKLAIPISGTVLFMASVFVFEFFFLSIV